MTAEAHALVLVTPEEYLASEEVADVRHEYLNGMVYAMAGTNVGHNRIAGRIYAGLLQRLAGKPCQPFFADIKVRVAAGNDQRYYYPDIGVACHPLADEATVEEEPTVLFEVLSESTRRVDTGEKRDGYLKIPSLRAYVLIEPRKMEVIIYRRTETGWSGEVLNDVSSELALPEIGCALPLSEIYAGSASR